MRRRRVGDALIPQPATTREALREAVQRIAPLHLTQYDRELGDAFDQAMRTGSTGWLRGFLAKWATFIAVERLPARATALREAERVCGDPYSSDQQVREAQQVIADTLRAAARDVTAAPSAAPRP
ncbi:hypothetical protein ACWGJ2_37455 [Streptomyces sp. NPDC054796]